MELVKKEWNADGKVAEGVEVKIENGMFVATGVVDAKVAGVDVKLEVRFKPQIVGELIKKAIPGQIDDLIIDTAMAALEKIQ